MDSKHIKVFYFIELIVTTLLLSYLSFFQSSHKNIHFVRVIPYAYLGCRMILFNFIKKRGDS